MRPFLLGCLLVAACGRTVTLTDDIDLTWDFKVTPFDRYVQDLHSPYVAGGSTWLWASSDDKDEKLDTWQIVSSDDTILKLDKPMYDGVSIGVQATAVGAGVVTLAVLDGHGSVVGHGEAEVAFPDAIELDAHGYMIVGDDDRAPQTEARIAAGDTATYLVRYFNAGRQLYGNGALSAAPSQVVDVVNQTSFLFEKREWLTLTPSAVGTEALHLLVNKQPAGDLQVTGVPESDITDIALVGQSEKGHKNGDWLVVLAQAFDADGKNVFGVDYQWQVGGVEQTADGDLYRYEYKGGDSQMLDVTRGAHADQMDIQSDRGYVDNSNHVGCDSGGGGSFVTAGALCFAACAFRRKKRK